LRRDLSCLCIPKRSKSVGRIPQLLRRKAGKAPDHRFGFPRAELLQLAQRRARHHVPSCPHVPQVMPAESLAASPTQPEIPLRAWYAEARRALWERPADVKANRGNVSIVANNRVVFNIKGNDYSLVVAMRYDKQIMFIRFIGTHSEYDRIDATTV
jgi:mRNA interferase HigB